MKYRVYLVMSAKSGKAYIGKGPDGRIEGKHNKAFHQLMRRGDMTQWESEPFSTPKDTLIAEATAIGIVKAFGKNMQLVNIQKASRKRFVPVIRFHLLRRKSKRFRGPLLSLFRLTHFRTVTVESLQIRHGFQRNLPNAPESIGHLNERASNCGCRKQAALRAIWWRWQREAEEYWLYSKLIILGGCLTA